jgi:hypothetical protein
MNMHEVFFDRANGTVSPEYLADTLGMSASHWVAMEQLDMESNVGQTCLDLMSVAAEFEAKMIDIDKDVKVVNWVLVYRQMQVFLFG